MSTVVEQVWAAWRILTDPEIPVVTLRELGILRDVTETPDGVEVVITPTYSGCPAMGQIEDDVGRAGQGRHSARVVTRLAPAWTTDWMSDEAKELRAYGIAPPHTTRPTSAWSFMRHRPAPDAVACPRCGSTHRRLVPIRVPACKALYKCLDCQEPFDYFKPY
jgi:ring-1,2-phenylacetyl-CoA epoxidase subunit PaaD